MTKININDIDILKYGYYLGNLIDNYDINGNLNFELFVIRSMKRQSTKNNIS